VTIEWVIRVTNKRLAIFPVVTLFAGHGQNAVLQLAQTLDQAAVEYKNQVLNILGKGSSLSPLAKKHF